MSNGTYNINVNLTASVFGADDLRKLKEELSGLGGVSLGKLVQGFALGDIAAKGLEKTIGMIVDLAKDAAEAVIGLGSSIASEGMKMNEFLESSRYGIATLLNANYEMRDASGKLLTGQEAYNRALELSEEHMKALRISGLETAATTQQLVANFQVAVSVAAMQNINDLKKIRDLTIGVTNAATAMKVPQEEVATAIRAIIQGRRVEMNTIARSLAGTSAQVREWQKAGTLLENLNKRLEVFTAGAQQAANSWAVTKSNIQEAFEVFSGQVMEGAFQKIRTKANESLLGIFDTKNMGINKQYAAIVSAFRDLFDGVGAAISDTIDGAIRTLGRINKWLEDNKEWVDEWKIDIQLIWVALKDAAAAVINLIGACVGLSKEIGVFDALKNTLIGVAVAFAHVADMATKATAVARIMKGEVKEGAKMLWDLEHGGSAVDKLSVALGKLQMQALASAPTVASVSNHVKYLTKEIDRLTESRNKALESKDTTTADKFTKAIVKRTTELKTAQAELKKLQNAATDPTTLKAKYPQDNTGKSGKGNSGRGELALARETADELVKIAKECLKQQQADLDASLKQRTISIENYYKQRKEIELDATRKEIGARQDQLAAFQAAPVGETNDQKNSREAQIKKIQGEINLLKLQEGNIDTENDRKKTAAIAKFEADVQKMKSQLETEMGGRSDETIDRDVFKKYEDQWFEALVNIETNAEAFDIVNKLIDVEQAKAKLQKLENEYTLTIEKMRLAETRINQEEANGTITPIKAYKEINALHDETAAKLNALIPKMEAYARTMGDEKTLVAIEKLKAGIKDTTTGTSELSKQLIDANTNNLANFFYDIATGAKTGSEAVRSFALSVVASFAQIASQQAALAIMKTLFAGSFSTGGEVVKKATGGYISGPGTETSDSIPALLSDGEYVLRASAVKRFGVGLLDKMNGIRSTAGVRGHFADGGWVGDSATNAGFLQGKFKHEVELGLDDGLIFRKMRSPEGASIQVQNTQKYQKRFNQSLGRG